MYVTSLPLPLSPSPLSAPKEGSLSSNGEEWDPSKPPLHRKGSSVAFDPKVQDKKVN